MNLVAPIQQLPHVATDLLRETRRAMGYAEPPKAVVLFLTDRCNLRCNMCAQYGESGVSVGRPLQEMDMGLIRSIIDQLAAFQPVLIFMGGEPMFHRQWPQALAYAKQRGLRVRVITNGTMLRRNIDTVLDGGLDWLSVSVDGPEDTHDVIRGRGTFKTVRTALQQLRDAKRERKAGHPEVTVAATISPVTHGRLLALADQLAQEDWGVDELTIQHLSWMLPEQMREHNIEQAAMFGIEAANMEGLVTDSDHVDVDVLLGQLRAIMQRDYPFRLRFYPEYDLDEVARYYGQGADYERSHKRCSFIWNATTVYPQGSITPCMNFAPGNLHEQPFMELWNSPDYRRFRRLLYRRGRMPACHRCCN